jgi:hypothetical protein
VAVALSSLAACYSTGEGPDPSASTLYFPVGMATSPGGNALYLVNSDFDLQFNSGTVLAIDLARLRKFLRPLWAPDPSHLPADPCIGLGVNVDPTVQPGPCGPLDLNHPPDSPESLVRASAKIGAFATDLLLVCRPSDPTTGVLSTAGLGRSHCGAPTDAGDPSGARLFVPVRGDPSLTFFDIDDDRGGRAPTFQLECGQASNNGRCSDPFRAGIDSNENTRGLTLPAEPFGIAVSDRADAIMITHQTGGAVSLFTGASSGGQTVLDVKPTLQFVYTGVPPATGVVGLPIPDVLIRELKRENDSRAAMAPPLPPLTLEQWLRIANYQQGFGISYRGAAEVDVFRFFDDQFAAPARPFLTRSSARGFNVVPSGQDSRDIAIDAAERTACATDCAARAGETGFDTAACDLGCDQIPLGAYVTNRSPPSLLVGQVLPASSTISNESIALYDAIALPAGPSRVVVGQIHDRRDPPLVRRPRIFAICFDARAIVVYDPIAHRVDGQIRTGRGPHALVMDPIEAIAYVTHFTDSYIGLIDLDQLHGDTFESIVATIGVPSPPRESK